MAEHELNPADDLPRTLTRADFDTEEEYRDYLAAEATEWEGVPPVNEARTAHWRSVGEATADVKRARITLSIPERNLSRLKAEALRQGLPYQTLINWILQQHLNGSAAR